MAQYFKGPDYAAISPNPLFDEAWYRTAYADVRRAIASGASYSGFLHFMRSGPDRGARAEPLLRRPAAAVRRAGPDRAGRVRRRRLPARAPRGARLHQALPGVRRLDLLRHLRPPHGPFAGAEGADHRPGLAHGAAAPLALRRGALPQGIPGRPTRRRDPFEHYLVEGAQAGHSPNAWFDEVWYLAYYADAREAVERGEYVSGYHHYLAVGSAQARMPRFDLKRALEGRLPGVTDPFLLRRSEELEKRIRTIHPEMLERESPRVWFVLNTLNPDIAFGGYQAAFEMMKATVRSGREIGVIVTEDALSDKEYFAYRKNDPELVEAILASPLVNHRLRQESLALHPDDEFVCYSVWDLWSTRDLVARTRRGRPFLVAQEYEPVFYDHASHRAMAVEGYGLPHVPIFNSELLKTYFEANRIGVFAEGAKPVQGVDYHVFEHVPSRLSAGGEPAKGGKEHRTLAFYARPEAHASRNLFEIGLAALRRACQGGVFDARWRFVGLGGLQEPMRIELGGGHELELVQKMAIDDYERFVTDIDVGLSLMYAPHPGLVHFEFAAAGAMVVTNTFENRSAELLTSLSANLVPCAPTIEGVHAALRTAAERAEDFEARRRNRLVLPDVTWSDVFSPAFVDAVFGAGEVAAVRRRGAAE